MHRISNSWILTGSYGRDIPVVFICFGGNGAVFLKFLKKLKKDVVTSLCRFWTGSILTCLLQKKQFRNRKIEVFSQLFFESFESFDENPRGDIFK